jgi:hypothetical protein
VIPKRIEKDEIAPLIPKVLIFSQSIIGKAVDSKFSSPVRANVSQKLVYWVTRLGRDQAHPEKLRTLGRAGELIDLKIRLDSPRMSPGKVERNRKIGLIAESVTKRSNGILPDLLESPDGIKGRS